MQRGKASSEALLLPRGGGPDAQGRGRRWYREVTPSDQVAGTAQRRPLWSQRGRRLIECGSSQIAGRARGSSTSCLGCFIPRPGKQRWMAAHEAVTCSRSERKSASASEAEARRLRCMRRECQLVSRSAFPRERQAGRRACTPVLQAYRRRAGSAPADTEEVCALLRAPLTVPAHCCTRRCRRAACIVQWSTSASHLGGRPIARYVLPVLA